MKKPILFIGTLLVGLVLFSSFDESRLFKMSKNMQIFANLYKELTETYVDEVAPAQLMRTGIDAMLKSLDPYTNYISGAQIEVARLERGTVGNIGLNLLEKEGKIYVAEILEDMAASDAGIKPGDEILTIDGKKVQGKTVEEIALFLNGQPESELGLSYKPLGKNTIEKKTLLRSLVPAKSVTYHKMFNDEVGYIKLNQFTRSCGKAVFEGIREMELEDDMKSLIFDLRGNPGGLLNEAVFISNLFIPQGKEVVSTKGKLADSYSSLEGKNVPSFLDLPMVVLTNGKSASASEIVSGVVQDYDRAVVMGQRTYGKGLVQQTKDIGFESKIKVTIAKYYLPTGRCIQAINYSGKYTDDGAREVPDSLKQSFQTINSGRTVYDSGGVNPDIVVEEETKSEFVESLKVDNQMFEFVNRYAAKIDSIASPETYEVGQEVVDQFKTFLLEQNYDYKSRTESLLAQLNAAAEEEEYTPEALSLVSAMQKKINDYQNSGLDAYDELIAKELKTEIVTRFHFQKGKTAATLYSDALIQQAADLLADPEAYKAVLR